MTDRQRALLNIGGGVCQHGGEAPRIGGRNNRIELSGHVLHRGSGGGMYTRKAYPTREAPRCVCDDQPDAREGQVGALMVATPTARGNKTAELCP